MNKKMLIIILSFGLLVAMIGYFAYQHVPPYYYQSKLFFMLNKDKLEALSDKLKQNQNIERIELSGHDLVEAKLIGDKESQNLTKDQIADYATLLSDAGVSPVWRTKYGILFYIGADHKFGKDFHIAYVLLDKVSGDEPICDSSIKDKNRGICFVLLEDNWSVNYEWVGI